MANIKGLKTVAYILLIVGGLDWLLIGLFQVDVIMKYLPSLANLIYILVGLSAVYELATNKKGM